MNKWILLCLIIFTNHYNSNGCEIFSVASKRISLHYTEPLNAALNLTNPEHKVAWKLINTKNQVLVKGIGARVRKVSLPIPGAYRLIFYEIKPFGMLIAQKSNSDTSFIEVREMKMEFDFESVQFSSPLKMNSDLSGIEMSIVVNITGKRSKDVDFGMGPVSTSGLNTNVVGLSEKSRKVFHEGKNVLVYKLTGSIRDNPYLTFNFVDIYGDVHPLYLKI